ncbi:MAG: peptidoglycan-binding domain-containing protein [Devosia sp.]
MMKTSFKTFRRGAIRPAILAIVAMTAVPVAAQQEIVGGILGLGGALILHDIYTKNQNKRTTRVDPAAAQRAAEARERMRLIQTRLNALGYDAGTPDGVSGPRTRRAISDFQLSIGSSPTGKLDEVELAALYEQSSGFGSASGATGFPSMAAPGGAVGAAPAFPSLGAPMAAPAQPAAAFPTLGGAAPSPAAGAAGAFPQLALPAAAAPVPAFPQLTGAPVASATPTPLVAGEGTPPVVVPVADNLATEIGKTGYAELAAQPAVLGVHLGSSKADFEAMFAANGFAGCAIGAAAQQCVRQTASLTDTIKGWVAGDEGVWALARLIQFNEPVPAEFVHTQFAQSYPELTADADGVVSSGTACAIGSQSVPALANLFDARLDPAGTADLPPALLQMAADCPVAFAVAFNEGNNLVSAVQVLLFDGTSVIRQNQRANQQRRSQLDADLKF